MSIGIGFAGAHRTGKTFLASKLSELVGVPFVKSDVSGVYARNDMIPSQVYTPDKTIFIQNKILDYHNELWDKQTGVFVTDRTPIDMLGYMMCNMPQNFIDDEINEGLQNYTKRCFESTEKYFKSVVEVLPGIPVVEDALKASIQTSHIDHVAYVITGILDRFESFNTVMVYQIPRRVTDIDERLDVCKQIFKTVKGSIS